MSNQYTSNPQQRLLNLILLLGNNISTGIAPLQLAKALRVTPSSITRDLANLEEAGWAEAVPSTGLWRITSKICRLSKSVEIHLGQEQQKLTELQKRYL